MSLLEATRQAVRERDWSAARELCGRLVEEPGLRYEALDLLAAVALATGEPQTALALAATAIGEAPNAPRGYLRRGGARLALGQSAEAETDFLKAIALDPASAAAHQALGLIRLADPTAAAACFEKALALHAAADRAAASSHWGLARAHLALGRPETARIGLERALELDPEHDLARRDLAALAFAAFDWVAADRHLEAALARPRPESEDATLRAARVDVLRHLGRFEDALRLALERPALGRVRQALGRLAADRRLSARSLALELREKLAGELTAAFDDPAIDPQDLVAATVALVLSGPGDEDLDLDLEGPGEAPAGRLFPRLLLRTLERALVTDLELERRLLLVRRSLLTADASLPPPAAGLEVACALAAQAALGLYLHPLDPAERAGAEVWRQRLAEHLAAFASTGAAAVEMTGFAWAIAMVALSRPLLPLVEAAGLSPAKLEPLAASFPVLGRLIASQVRDPALERSFAAELRSSVWREDATSAPVRQQYEAYPYPRWSGLRLDSEPCSPAAVLHGLFPRLPLPAFLAGSCRVLIAGCGTGQQAIAAAAQFRDASIQAIDLSAESLAYGRRMAGAYDGILPALARLELRRADLLELSPADGLFEVVLCTGVLHHLADPETGWRHLRSLVRPGGVMKVALYSRAARRKLAAARVGLGPVATDEELREARQRLASGPHAAALARFIDFYSLVGCRDLLFHVREQSYSLPEIAAMLERLNLRFLGFELPRELAGELYSRLYPLDPERRNLGNWAALEAAWPDTFLDMYQLWCQVPGPS